MQFFPHYPSSRNKRSTFLRKQKNTGDDRTDSQLTQILLFRKPKFHKEQICLYSLQLYTALHWAYWKSETRDPGRLQVGPPGRRTPKCLGGTRDLGPPKWDLGSGTSKHSSGTQNPGLLKWDPGHGTPKNIQVEPGSSNFQ